MRKNRNKAQMSNNLFFYIIAAIVLALIIGYGYNSLKKITITTNNLLYIGFKNDLEKSITRLQGDSGAVSRDLFDIPTDYNKICFINWEADAPTAGIMQPGGDDFVPVVYDSWSMAPNLRPNNNIFLIGKRVVHSFHIEHIIVEDLVNNWVCMDLVAGKVKIKLNNSGDNILIGNW